MNKAISYLKKVGVSIIIILLITFLLRLFIKPDPHLGYFIISFILKVFFGLSGLFMIFLTLIYIRKLSNNIFYILTSVVNICSFYELVTAHVNTDNFYVFIIYLLFVIIGLTQIYLSVNSKSYNDSKD